MGLLVLHYAAEIATVAGFFLALWQAVKKSKPREDKKGDK